MRRRLSLPALVVGTGAAGAIVLTVVAALLVSVLGGISSGAEITITRTAAAGFEGAPEQPVFIVIAGTDDRPGVGGARNDALHVVGVNPAMGKATILNIPRDTYITIPGRGQQKITDANTLGGPQLIAQTIQSFTGAPVSYVVTTNFEGFTGLVDDMGGVDVNIPVPLRDQFSGTDLSPGVHHLDGNLALAVARDRHSMPRGDIDRTGNQALLLLAALQKIKAQNPSPTDTLRLAAILARHIKSTNGVGLRDYYFLGRLALSLDPANVKSVTVPSTTGQAGGASVVFPTADAPAVLKNFADDGVLE